MNKVHTTLLQYVIGVQEIMLDS